MPTGLNRGAPRRKKPARPLAQQQCLEGSSAANARHERAGTGRTTGGGNNRAVRKRTPRPSAFVGREESSRPVGAPEEGTQKEKKSPQHIHRFLFLFFFFLNPLTLVARARIQEQAGAGSIVVDCQPRARAVSWPDAHRLAGLSGNNALHQVAAAA